MRIMFALILIVGMGLAGFAVYMAQDRFSEYQDQLATQQVELSKNVKLVKVFISKTPLRYGHRLTKEDVAYIGWPEQAVPEGSFTDPIALFGEDGTEFRTILRAMEAGEAIMAVKVTKPGEDAGVSSRLGAGMRAFTIRVDVASGVSGFLRPGDVVDVYWSGNIGPRSVTKLILENIKLIAIDQIADEDRDRPIVARTVTAEVAPDVVAALVQAQSTGSLLLSLRGADDTAQFGDIEVDQSQLLGIEEPKNEPVARVEEKKVCTIRNRKGAEVVLIEIPCSD